MSNNVTGQTGVPVALDRRPSRLTSALTHVQSTEAHPPHHAHFNEHPETHTNGQETLPPHVPETKGSQQQNKTKSVVDIEHVPVDDDPREWSNLKKNLVLTMMTISVVSLPPSLIKQPLGRTDETARSTYQSKYLQPCH